MKYRASKGRNGIWRPAILLAATLALCWSAPSFAKPHHGGGPGGGGFPRMSGPFHGAGGPWAGPGRAGPGPWGPPPGPPTGPQFDPRRHNGYWVGGRWYNGPPPDQVERAPNFRPGFAPFRPGAFLPPQFAADPVGDWARFHLRRPPYGYEWVQAGNEFLLVSMSTGQIFDVTPYD